MTFTPTLPNGCFIIEPNVINDGRGFFMESFSQAKFEAGTGLTINFVQDNQSYSTKGVLRGLHYQTGSYAQAKLVRVLQGDVLDVAVDIRPESATYGAHVAVVLSAANNKQLFIPRGFAHGFLVLSDTATFFYKCDNLYNKESEGGIVYNDPSIGINWGMAQENLLISDKDIALPDLQNSKKVW
ncbi:dTDP-4-dehydrorhamnose 3,5-epimerase [Flavobacterium rivuli WB 3.3-2 = DSM 21788]|uniref:dTDP-4-dehydrorhamnose 3,5-epimerase n=1 Tax=Flavobacterium rivuli WB 3.3-2 = DSM 21788 TaxID=1121895 RepID=A0A0A2M2X7_9FLAO|nr:dTDP-4-dehydrorhamnose 3,5-epimerase [Flavobacterium rivuli]KGO85818.1 dTDP-4-dehydrorhamnose 3,5-epimerase [Flavobacterium rivuli WB 3.3-2 = DSM 21788]